MARLTYYASLITKNATEFKKISQYIVADTYFSKLPFLEAVSKSKLFLISRLRSDSDLEYLFYGSLTSKKGAPKKHDGKVDFNNLSMKHFNLDYQDDAMRVYGAMVYSVAFKVFQRFCFSFLMSHQKNQHLISSVICFQFPNVLPSMAITCSFVISEIEFSHSIKQFSN